MKQIRNFFGRSKFDFKILKEFDKGNSCASVAVKYSTPKQTLSTRNKSRKKEKSSFMNV